jgi:hypothetical protein
MAAARLHTDLALAGIKSRPAPLGAPKSQDPVEPKLSDGNQTLRIRTDKGPRRMQGAMPLFGAKAAL